MYLFLDLVHVTGITYVGSPFVVVINVNWDQYLAL